MFVYSTSIGCQHSYFMLDLDNVLKLDVRCRTYNVELQCRMYRNNVQCKGSGSELN